MYYDPCAVGERIQLLRKERELTQDQLAIDLNISDRYMRNLERGERVPSIDLFVELREKFDHPLIILFWELRHLKGNKSCRNNFRKPAKH